MLGFRRLDTHDDFFLVAAPSLELAPIARAYHLELLNRVRLLPHHHLVEADAVLYENYAPYYQKIGDRLQPNFDPSVLSSASRHSFFIAAESRGDFWISGLELLMGYDYEKSEVGSGRKEVRVTSNDFEIDVLAELLLLPNSTQIEYLTKTRSPKQLAALTKQVGDRLRGNVAIEELQREQDLKMFEEQQGFEQLKKAGFNL
ncbi:MAG: hypothetical protein HWQ38_23970 [Nostoc sp. NMS7]|uniref:hypothetical protein n=1 Tax=Nostoc sp. NMS7 TaxID=2815391 RepID=UPI0025F6E1F5|nr:hypothetical protein [Nostoc sp. NMS7]MBN3949350.1 hypothetical protein [Nostoc sp. NMS7]